MTDKPYSKGSLRGAALCHLPGRRSAIATGHGCRGGGKLQAGAATSGAACGGSKPAATFCWLGAWPRALARASRVALRCTVPVATPRMICFKGNKDAPGYPRQQKQCANNCPGSERVAPWTPSLGEKKPLPVIFTNPEGVQEQINPLQQFQGPGDLFSARFQHLLGGVKEIFSGQPSVTDKAKCTSGRGRDRICTERQTRG